MFSTFGALQLFLAKFYFSRLPPDFVRAGAGAGSGFGALVMEGVSGGGASRVMGSRAMVVFAASAQHYHYATRAMFVTLNASPT